MRNNRFVSKMNNIHKHNKGFTLVELVVVLVLMAILLSISIAMGLGWKDWADFNHENAMAEEIFFAAQNQLTEYDSSRTLDLKVVNELRQIGDSNSTYDNSIVLSQNMLEQISYDMSGESEVKYKWDDVWKLNQNPDSQRGVIIRLKASKGDYKDYLNGTIVSKTDKSRLGAKILFDIITGYVSDSGALNAAITLEFSPDSGQVFSVCYSDRYDSLLYEGEAAGEGKTSLSVMNRILTERKNKMLGYYSVTELTQRIRGRGMTKTYLELDMENSELLTMKVIDKGSGENKLGDDDSLIFTVYNGQVQGNPLMTFNVAYSTIPVCSSYAEGLSKAMANPLTLNFNMYSGKYKNNNGVPFRVPVWRIDNEVYIVLDAADVQAQTLAYSNSIYFGQTYSSEAPNPGEQSFRNTYSFYRFGLADVTNYIYADVCVGKMGYAITDSVESGRRIDNKHVSHSKLASDQKDGFKGECVCFGEYSKDDKDDVYIDINNARHLYNVRYETDYKRSDMESVKEIYKLTADISWNEFLGKGENNTTINYFLNSYDSSKDNISRSVSGIDYDGKFFATRSVESGKYTDTSQYPFPGFRKLDSMDVFTQDKSYTKDKNESFIISDLNISVTANIVYGVYGQAVKDKCLDSSDNEDYSKILGTTTDEGGVGALSDTRAGRLPLGLFAENMGTISNITINRHVVEGLEIVNDNTVYTCMVGGFTGNNIGKLDKLTILDFQSDGESAAKISRVTGRTDVGGILGRESFALSDADADVQIKGMLNYAEVSGLENVGGIAGRVWVNYPDNEETQTENYFFDGYSISSDSKSMSDENVVRADEVIIQDCENRGTIYGLLNDKVVKERIKNGKEVNIDETSIKDLKCSFIGGIVGSALNGESIEDSISADYLAGSGGPIKLVNCDSYVVYDTGSDSFINDLSNVEEHPSLTNDNYVGGLIGYGRLTVLEKCNSKPDDEMMEGDVSKAFIFGNRYVGGLIGCAELCRFDMGEQEENETISDYAVTNYNNVIGRMYVGGIAGANGVGNIDADKMNYREPSLNKAAPASRIIREDNSVLFHKALNKGIVLTLKSSRPFIAGIMDEWTEADYENISKIFEDEELTGLSGGIVGLNCSSIKECDNIQSEDVKNLSMKIVSSNYTGNQTIDLYTDEIKAEDIVKIIESSKFGGNAVGGIAGACFEGGTINVPTDDWSNSYSSKVDAFVYGQDYVGGSAGLTKSKESDLYNCMNKLIADNNTSSGMLVVGRDAVGGYVGRIGGLCWDYETTTVPYKVKGRYGIGGVFGVVTSDDELAVSIDPAVTNKKCQIDGIAYVGGYLGIADSSEDIELKGVNNKEIDLNYIDVYGKYFVGGIAGGISGNKKTLKYIASSEFALGSNVSINAESYAGGIAGLYTVESESNDFCSVSEDHETNDGKLYKIVADNLIEEGNYVDYEKAFAKIADTDISSGNIFGVPTDDDYLCEIDFPDYAERTNSNPAQVTAKIFAAGAFGYVPENVQLKIDGFVNNGNIATTEVINGNVSESLMDDVRYSYLGGVVGRVSGNMTLVNCENKKRGEDTASSSYYVSKATYIGGLTEVNAGIIRGTGERDNDGKIKESGYLINSVNATYSGKNYGAIAGINGTKNTYVSTDVNNKVDNENSTGLILWCKNAKILSTDRDSITGENGNASGIVAAVGGNSAVVECQNEKTINAVDIASGLVGEVKKGSCIIDSCTNADDANISASGTASGIVGIDLASDALIVRNCINIGTITSTGENGNAAGIVGKGTSQNHNSEKPFLINNCINHGAIDASGCVAGIISDSNSPRIEISESVNTGVITISEKHAREEDDGSSYDAAGIVCDTHKNGIINKCRNYGTGLYYGITKGTAQSLHYSLDASYAKNHIGSVAQEEPSNDKLWNFYLGEETAIDKPKRFKAVMSYEGLDDEKIDISSCVFAPGKEGDSGQDETTLQHHDESCNYAVKTQDENSQDESLQDENRYKLMYTIQPVFNFKGTEETDIGFDAFSIVWDNLGEEGTVSYHIDIYSNEKVITLQRKDGNNNFIPIKTQFDVNGSPAEDTFILNKNGEIGIVEYYIRGDKQSQNITITSPHGFTISSINKIDVVIDGCTNSENKVGILAFKWNEYGTITSNAPATRIMVSHDSDPEEFYYTGVNDIKSLIDAVSDIYRTHIFQSEIPLYSVEDKTGGVATHKIKSYDFETGIEKMSLLFNLQDETWRESIFVKDYSTYSSGTVSYRVRLYEQLDAKYMDFINAYINDELTSDLGVGMNNTSDSDSFGDIRSGTEKTEDGYSDDEDESEGEGTSESNSDDDTDANVATPGDAPE
ncbi:MAG: MSCRAMM family adhesin SdrC [Eubacterium sp.]|nr:MSCRAMM family adhesin SdrC [Eubacterium sp.]